MRKKIRAMSDLAFSLSIVVSDFVNGPNQNLDQTVYHNLASFSSYFFIQPLALHPCISSMVLLSFFWPESSHSFS